MLDKFGSKLASWKKNSLNQAGRRVLVKACLNSLPLYWFQLYRIPKGILKDMDRIRRNFFWGDQAQDGVKGSKLHLVKWSNVCKAKNKGGLSLDNLSTRNSTLLLKWWWKWFSERENLWWNVIQQKYQLVSHRGLDQCGDLTSLSYIWRDISSPHNLQQWLDLFNERGFRWIVGKGDSILFWEDNWIGDQSLANRFLRLYSISRWKFCKVSIVSEKWLDNQSLKWTRNLRMWEA